MSLSVYILLLIYLLVQFPFLLIFLYIICVYSQNAMLGCLINLYKLSFDLFGCKYRLSLLSAITFWLKIFCFRMFKQIEKVQRMIKRALKYASPSVAMLYYQISLLLIKHYKYTRSLALPSQQYSAYPEVHLLQCFSILVHLYLNFFLCKQQNEYVFRLYISK